MDHEEIKHEPLSPPPSDKSETPSEEPLCNGRDTESVEAPLDFSVKTKVTGVNDSNSVENDLFRREKTISDASSDISGSDTEQEMIGQPQTMPPSTLPGFAFPPSSTATLSPFAMLNNPLVAAASAAASFPNGFPAGFSGSNLPLANFFDPRQLTQLNLLLQAHVQQQQQQQLQQHQHHQSSGDGKTARPFKAYPKDPLSLPLGIYPGSTGFSGLPGGVDAISLAALQQNSEELFKQYRDYVHKTQGLLNRRGSAGAGGAGSTGHRISGETASAAPVKARESSSASNSPPVLEISSGTSSLNSVQISNQSTSTTNTNQQVTTSPRSTSPLNHSDSESQHRGRKRPTTLPDTQKDAAYWERRRKNNDAAKRSRDSRRAKEDEIAIRAAFLEQENLKLRVEVTALKTETAKLRQLLYTS